MIRCWAGSVKYRSKELRPLEQPTEICADDDRQGIRMELSHVGQTDDLQIDHDPLDHLATDPFQYDIMLCSICAVQIQRAKVVVPARGE